MSSDNPALPRLQAIDEYSEEVILAGQNVWKVGRSSTNDIVLEDPMVSRSHALIQRTEGQQFLLVDLGSRNGAHVNGRRVSVPVYLRNGDRITFGPREYTFCGEEIASPTSGQQVHEEQATQALHALKMITVLVVDIRDFTGLSQRLDESVLARTIGTWIRKMGKILESKDSWEQKFIGDAVMAVWVHEDDDPLAAIRRAFESLRSMVHATTEIQAELELADPIVVGAGLNSGLASVGNMGSEAFADYTALGDGVNKAFRLETASKQLGVDLLVGEDAYTSLHDLTEAQQLFKEHLAELKGYEQPAKAYSLPFDKLGAAVSALAKSPAEEVTRYRS